MSFLEFLKFKKKKISNSPRIEVNAVSRKKYPDRIRVKKSPDGKFLKQARENGLTNDEMQFLQENVFRITGEYELSETQKGKIANWIKSFINQNPDSQAIWQIIEADMTGVWRKNFINALAECVTKNEDPKLNFLYGALFTILEAHDNRKSDFLSTYKSIKQIFEESKKLDEEKQKEKKAEKYSEDITRLVENSGTKFISPSRDFVKLELRKIISENNPKKWHEKICKFLDICLGAEQLKKFLIENSFKTFDEKFLESINPEKQIQRISKVDFQIQVPANEGVATDNAVFELFTREQLQKESGTLMHCVGNSDHYYNKIRDGKIRIFSVRRKFPFSVDAESESYYRSRFTIEYDVENKRILQFQGIDNHLVDNEMLNGTIKNLRESGVEVAGLNFGPKICAFQKESDYMLLVNKNSSALEQVNKILKEGFTNLGNYPVLVGNGDNLTLLFELLQNKNLFIKFHWYIDNFTFPEVIQSSLYLSNQTTLYDSDGPYQRELLMSFPKVKKITGSVYMDIASGYERSKRDSDKRFPLLEEVEQTIEMAFERFEDLGYVKWFIEFNLPRLVKKYGGYEKLIASGKVKISKLTKLRY